VLALNSKAHAEQIRSVDVERMVAPGCADMGGNRAQVWSVRPVAVLIDNHMSCHMSCHMVTARREVLVQLDDDLVEQLDALAAGLGANRSELIRRRAQAVLDAEGLAAADRQLRSANKRQPADPRLVQSARRLAAQTTPVW
jgi:hypothetical protein